MKHLLTLSILMLLCFTDGRAQASTQPLTFHSKDFGWTITIPENFTSVPAADWEKLQNKGVGAIEDTYGQEVVNQAKTIFVFKSGDHNYLEANYQPFDSAVDGDYDESRLAVQ